MYDRMVKILSCDQSWRLGLIQVLVIAVVVVDDDDDDHDEGAGAGDFELRWWYLMVTVEVVNHRSIYHPKMGINTFDMYSFPITKKTLLDILRMFTGCLLSMPYRSALSLWPASKQH